MAFFANNYSFIFLGFILVLVVWFCIDRMASLKWAIGSIAVTLAILGTFQVLTSTNASEIKNGEEFDAILASGNPVLLELYSNF